MPRNRWQRGRITRTEGYDFVTCRICGDRRRVISGRHLAKHEIDRKAYMAEYRLSADELIATAFRVNRLILVVFRSSNHGFIATPKGEPKSNRNSVLKTE